MAIGRYLLAVHNILSPFSPFTFHPFTFHPFLSTFFVSLQFNNKNKTMRKFFTLLVLVFLCGVGFAQSFSLFFSGQDGRNRHVFMNRVVITNLTRDWSETLVWPDTILNLFNVTGIEEYERSSALRLSAGAANPFDGMTCFDLNVAEKGNVTVCVTDVCGRLVVSQVFDQLQCGIHKMKISLSKAGVYFIVASQNGETASVKVVNSGNGGVDALSYIGGDVASEQMVGIKSHQKGNTEKPFVLGDQLEVVGYATINGEEVESDHVVQSPMGSQTIVIPFAEICVGGQPCPDMPTLTDYEGNIYNTVQIGSQCWMKENLRTKHYADGELILDADSSLFFASFLPILCYPNADSSVVPTYGFLYNKAAMRHEVYDIGKGPDDWQGVCPAGWHVPSNNEWNEMEELFTYEDVTQNGGRGDHAGKLSGGGPGVWTESNTTGAPGDYSYPDRNISGFSALPAGGRETGNHPFGSFALFWCASGEARIFNYDYNQVFCVSYEGFPCLSVRCVRD